MIGCSSGVEEAKLATIKEGSTRSEVEAIIGTPSEAFVANGVTYRIYRVRLAMPVPGAKPGLGSAGETIGLGLIELFGGDHDYLAIVYTKDNKVLAFRAADKKPVAIKKLKVAIERIAFRDELAARAAKGDPEAQYMLAYRLNDLSKAWKWYCLAAHQGHPEARYAMGNYYRYGHAPLQKDLLRAYIWYRLAEASGYEGGVSRSVKTETGWKCCEVKRYSELIADQMMPWQLEKGERLVSNWQPNPEVCQDGIDPSVN
jgi:hypothetical protein